MWSTARRTTLQLAWNAFGQEWQSLQNELLSLQSQLELDAFRSKRQYQAAVKAVSISSSTRGVSRRSSFFWTLMKIWSLFLTDKRSNARKPQNSFHWRPVNNLPAPAGKRPWWWRVRRVGVSTVSSMLVGCCLYDEKGGVGGYPLLWTRIKWRRNSSKMRLRPDCD